MKGLKRSWDARLTKGRFAIIAAVIPTLMEVLAKCRRDKIEKLAASLAFYSVFAIAPMIMFGLALSGYIAERREATDFITAVAQRLLGARAAEALQPVLESGGRPHGLSALIGIATLLFGASTTFFHLEDVVNIVWASPPRPAAWLADYIKRRVFSFFLVIALTLVFLVAPTVTIVAAGYGRSQVAAALLSVLLEGLFFSTVFKVLPDVPVRWRDVWEGAAVTAVLMTAAQALMGLYLGRLASRSLYGGAGAFLAMLFWLYVSAQILLFGAELVSVRSRRLPSGVRR